MQTPSSPRGIDQWQEARDHAMELLWHQKEHAEERVLELLRGDMALVLEKNAQHDEICRLENELNAYKECAKAVCEANELLRRQEEESKRRVGQLESEKLELQRQLDDLRQQQHQEREEHAFRVAAAQNPSHEAAMAAKMLPVAMAVPIAVMMQPQLSTKAAGKHKRRRPTGIETDTTHLTEDHHDVEESVLPQPPQSRSPTVAAHRRKCNAARKLFEDDDEPEQKKARRTLEVCGEVFDTTSQETSSQETTSQETSSQETTSQETTSQKTTSQKTTSKERGSAETETAAVAEVIQIPAISLKRRRSADDQSMPPKTSKRLRSFSTLMRFV